MPPGNQQSIPEPIAVIGVGCRYPGGIRDLDSFWEVLREGRDVIGPMPENRLGKPGQLVDPGRNPGKIVTDKGGFLDRIDEFDAAFFNISPREAELLDPQQRVMLEITFEALEDAGVKLRRIWGSKTGVYVGQWTSDYEHRVIRATRDVDLYATTGTGRYATAGRIAYAFNLQGPSMAVDTACSSSLVTIHLACQALRNGEIDYGFAGGVNIILDPFISIGYSRSKILSDYGRCRFGDSSGSGYVRSEGAGVVLLKRLSDAERDGDKIYAVIRGSRVNSDGQSNKYLVAPSHLTQADMLRDAYRSAGVDPSEVDYVEAHGTGTKAGDPTEISALSRVLGEGRGPGEKCLLGSVKTNIGHTEAASGIAGFLKALLVLRHREVPASLHLKDPNPAVDWAHSPFELTQKPVPLKGDGQPLLAGVNSFGITGTNAHIIIQEVVQAETPAAWKQGITRFALPVSANTTGALESYAGAYADLLNRADDKTFRELVHNIVFRKSDLNDRRLILFSGREDLAASLRAVQRHDVSAEVQEGTAASPRPPKTAFVFPGQGSQWIGMGRRLYQSEPVFREAIQACSEALSAHVSWNLEQQLLNEDRDDLYDKQDVLQPTLFAMEIALARLWQSWGIEPDAVVGHSMGEVVAAYLAGSLTLEDAAAVICIRSGLMVTLSGASGMLYAALSPDAAERYIAGNDRLNVAINNSPDSVVIGGDTADLEALQKQLESDEVFCRRVKMDVASHSPQMDPLLDRLRSSVAHIRASENRIPFYSSVRHGVLSGSELDADYWVSNLRRPVQFAKTIQQLITDGYRVFIEVSPHAVLTNSIEENARALETPVAAFGSLARHADEEEAFLAAVGKAYCNGLYPDWGKLYDAKFTKVNLPAYPWDREHFWVDESVAGNVQGQAETRNGKPAHPLLARRMDIPAPASGYVWETAVSMEAFPWLEDHQVLDAVVFPAAAYMEMVRAALDEVFGPGEREIEGFRIGGALSLAPGKVRILQTALENRAGNGYDLVIRSRDARETDWQEHAAAGVVVNYARNLDGLKAEMKTETIAAEAHYELARSMNFPYGPLFRTVQGLETAGAFWSAGLKLGEALRFQAGDYGLHPALLDGAIQVALNLSREKHAGSAYLPVGVDKLWFADDLRAVTDARVALTGRPADGDTLLADMVVEQDGRIILRAEGLRLTRLRTQSGTQQSLEEALYETIWNEAALPAEKEEGTVYLIDPPAGWPVDSHTVMVGWKGSPVDAQRSLDPGDTAAWENLAQEIAAAGPDPVVVYNAVTAREAFSDDILYSEALSSAFLLLARALARAEKPVRLRLIANGSRAFLNNDINLAAAPLWGLGNVMLNEHPELHLSRLDLPAEPTTGDWNLARDWALGGGPENEWALRDGKFYVARLVHLSPDQGSAKEAASRANGRAFAVFQPEPGLVDNLEIREIKRREPAPDEVEVEVRALGINFMNLMSVLGIYPGKEKGFGTLGIECAGVVTRAGSAVSHLKPGDEVLGMCYHSMASHVNVKAALMRRKPAAMGFAEAATIPVVFLTAYYALVHLGRLKAGERLLIHSATGGLGLAAIQIAKDCGAEVFATAGTEEKRALLRSMGINHVYHSRNLDFAGQIMDDTGGEGVDLVLNSLTGEAMLRSLGLLRNFGRFMEVGKKDVYDNSRIGLEVFSRGLSYHMIDLEKMVHEAPSVLGDLLEPVLGKFAAGAYQPLPAKVFGVDEAKEAFNYMSKARHIGKIVVEPADRDPEILPAAAEARFDARATYLLTGGYGGIGLTFVQWMFGQGARNFMLAGRSGPGQEATAIIDRLREQGARIVIRKADVSQRHDLQDMLRDIPVDAPLKGVFHLAGFLDDAALRNITPEQYHRVLRPKVSGAWHLHELTRGLDLDYFVLFASSSLLFGSPGQAAYVAANAFLDQLAEYRRSQGLPATSIQWGTVAEVGLAVADALQAERLEEEGVIALQPGELPALFRAVFRSGKPVTGAFRFNLARWQQAYRTAAANPYYEKLRARLSDDQSPGAASFRDSLVALPPDEAADAVETRLKELVSAVVKKPAETMAGKLAFKTLGIDSLMSIQLKNKIEGAFEIPVSVTSFWTYATLREYTAYLVSALQLDGESGREAAATRQEDRPAPKPVEVPKAEDIADEDISDLLAAELEDLG